MFRRAGEALLSYKPCTLMSPLSVAEILPLEELYDVVIIDEASQMPPEYAIGGLARAKQAVIVGDPNQLPPTRFFQSVADDEYEDDILESILEVAMTSFHPARRLLWHYRSQHEDLIRFSDSEFYGNLIIPITASPGNDNKGIKHHYVQDGVYYAGGVNHIEAQSIVKEAINLMQYWPDESIGIATMNSKQAAYIETEFQILTEFDVQVQDYLNYWKS